MFEQTFECYRLTLEHFYVDTDGNKHKMTDPLVVQMAYDYGTNFGTRGTMYCVNEMLKKLEHAMLRLVEEQFEGVDNGRNV